MSNNFTNPELIKDRDFFLTINFSLSISSNFNLKSFILK